MIVGGFGLFPDGLSVALFTGVLSGAEWERDQHLSRVRSGSRSFEPFVGSL